MRPSRAATILLCCFFPLIVGSRSSVFAQQPSQVNEKERGIELYRKGAFSEAVEALKEAVKKQQRDSDAWYYLGLSLHRAGEIKDARKAFEKTISLRPDFAPSYLDGTGHRGRAQDQVYSRNEGRQTIIRDWQP